MTVQKKILDLTGSQYLVQKVKSAISDVDSSLSTHIADTDIHVTASDKTTWNTVTSKANDSDVVHKSGDESVIGSKRFGVVQSFTGYPSIRLYSTIDDVTVLPQYAQQLDIRFTDKNNNIIAYFIFQHRTDINEPFRTCWRQQKMDGTSGYYSINFNNLGKFYPENNNAIDLGGSGNRWKSVYATNYYYGIDNVEFSDKFVTTDTNQTISGNKTFSNIISSNGSYLGNESSGNERTNLYLLANRDITGQSGAYIGRFRQNRAQGEMSGGEVSFISFDFLENSIRYTRCFTMGLTDWDSNGVPQTYYLTAPNGKGSLGTALQKWLTINGLNPSSLGMPDLSNGIDISSYITDLTGSPNIYSPPANGYIALRSTTANVLGIVENTTGMGSFSRGSNQVLAVYLPVVKNSSISIYAICSSLTHAKFIPCLGNV